MKAKNCFLFVVSVKMYPFSMVNATIFPKGCAIFEED